MPDNVITVSSVHKRKNQIVYLFSAAVIFLYPVFVLLWGETAGLGLGLFALAGFAVMPFRDTTQQASREEKLFYFSILFFFIAALFVTLLGGIDEGGIKKLGKFSHLLLAIPVYIYLKRVGVSLAAFWYGLAIGAIVAGGLAIHEAWAIHETWDKPIAYRVHGNTHPIIFGDLALALGIMSLAGLGWFRARAQWQTVLPVLAALAGLLASALSQSRGGWIAIPFVVLVFFWYAGSRLHKWQRWASVAVVILTLLLVYFVPSTGVQKTLQRTVTNLVNYAHSDIRSNVRRSSVGTRLEMWQAAWHIFLENPLHGVGWGHYKESAQALVDMGLRNPSASRWGHPHSQFFSALVNGGVIAFVAMLLLFFVPLKLLKDTVRQKTTVDMCRLALAGILLIITFMSFGFSEAIFERAKPVSFFAFYLAVIFAAIQTRLNIFRQQKIQRKQSLSVIIIAQDEADRIERCLDSVANWVDEIIVLDSGSTDNTVEIARRYTDKVFETDWPGYGPQKQRALEKASCDWVLSIDADESVTSELRQDIDMALNEYPECIAYRTPWAVTVYGHRMDFGRSARAPMRLFQRKGARFTDAQVHEHIVVPEGKTGQLQGRLLHYTHRDYGHALYKSVHYAWLGAQKKFNDGRKSGGLLLALIRAIWTFILIYFIRLGFLDGQVGFLVAMIYSQNSFNKYAGLWTLQRQAATGKRKGSIE